MAFSVTTERVGTVKRKRWTTCLVQVSVNLRIRVLFSYNVNAKLIRIHSLVNQNCSWNHYKTCKITLPWDNYTLKKKKSSVDNRYNFLSCSKPFSKEYIKRMLGSLILSAFNQRGRLLGSFSLENKCSKENTELYRATSKERETKKGTQWRIIPNV